MPSSLMRAPFVCRRCLRASLQPRIVHRAGYSSTSQPEQPKKSEAEEKQEASKDEGESSEAKGLGPMARRLEEATEEALLTGGRAGRQAVEDAGFSEELKEKLLDKIADAKFRKQYPGAFAAADLSSAAGEGTRHMATSQPWTGDEDTADAVLRMLDDAKKPLKPGLRGKQSQPLAPAPVDMRIRRDAARTPGQRAGHARERAAAYADLGMKARAGLTEAEREELRREFRERFQPAARAVPATLSGLAALANERIEDAIARGQFRDIPRGPAVQRDARADNPFIDTTEYIMNKMIQRQDMVPPWIEKQQELVRAADVFRARLRSDWRRHAARMIAARGGGLEDHVRMAEAYAAAEAVHNPRPRSVDQIPVPSSSTDDPVMVKMRQQAASAQAPDPNSPPPPPPPSSSSSSSSTPLPKPFRDAAWEKAEHGYLTLSIENLNRLARSYNLMAPDLAKKPYFSLERELRACYADVAPLLPGEIRERALGKRGGGAGGMTRAEGAGIAGVLEGLAGSGEDVRIHLEAGEKAYGLREWWRDFWKKG